MKKNDSKERVKVFTRKNNQSNILKSNSYSYVSESQNQHKVDSSVDKFDMDSKHDPVPKTTTWELKLLLLQV